MPVTHALAAMPPNLVARMRIVEQAGAQGYIVARNTTMRLARHDYVLLMDDDAYVTSGEGLARAVQVLETNASVAAFACAQAEVDGTPWPSAMQPAPVAYPCYVAAYIGFAHLLRRDVFLALGGYRESFHFYGEEKDFCLRLLDAGFHVVYMPDVTVAHVPDPAGRSQSRYLRHAVKNDCLCALYNEPLPLLLVTMPIRLSRYFAMPPTPDVT